MISIFGTDGVRGPAGEGLLALDRAVYLGAAFGQVLGGGKTVAVARDTRESGPALRDAIVAGLRGASVAVEDLGVLPTPALSRWIACGDHVSGGVMITASHNPWRDNGLKFFGADGGKASDVTQAACEEALTKIEVLDAMSSGFADYVDVASRAAADYIESLTEGRAGALAGRLVVADDAAGAASGILGRVLRACGADVLAFAPLPDGRNINEGVGAVHPEQAASRVLEAGAWAGLVVDGDGDRIMLIDETGAVRDGDAILGFLAERMHGAGDLRGGAVVGTVTTNGGLEQYLRSRGIALVRTPVGDRHISTAMTERGCNLGGESSGHVLLPDLCPTGDGTRVGLEVLFAATGSDPPLSELLGAVPMFPSSSRKVPDGGVRPPVEQLLAAPVASAALEAIGEGGGRALVRYSGTESYLRIQVEGPSEDLVEAWADRLVAATVGAFPD